MYLFKVFFEHFGFGLIIPFSIVWMLQKGLTLPEIGIIQSVVFLTTFLLEIPTGVFADRWGSKKSLIAGSIFHVFGMGLMIISHSFGAFLLSSICTGIAWAFISGAEEVYIHQTLLDKNIRQTIRSYISNIAITDETSTILGMILGTFIVSLFTLQAVFIIASLSLLVSVFILMLFLPEDTKILSNSQTVIESPKTLLDFYHAYKQYVFLFIGLAILFESSRIVWQPHLVATGWSVAQLGIVFAILKIFSILGAFLAKKLHANHKVLLLIFGIVGGISLLLFSVQNQWMAFIFLGVYFLCENIYRVNQAAYLLEISPDSKNTATFLSGANLIRNMTSAVITPGISYASGYTLFGTIGFLVVGKIGVGVLLIYKSSFAYSRKHSGDKLSHV